jgi:hypothetical protein
MFGIKSRPKPTKSSMKEEFGFESLTHDNVDYPMTPQPIIVNNTVYDFIDWEYSYGGSGDLRKIILRHQDAVRSKHIHARFTSDSNGSLFGIWMLFISDNRKVTK